MPAEEVGAAYVAIRAVATGFREQATQEVNQALASVRERATIPIRAQVDTTAANRVQQSFQPVVAGARQMGSETEGAYRKTEAASHHAFETIRTTHDGIRARFGETLRAASLMGGGVAIAYGAFSQGREAIQVTNELAHSTGILSAATGLSARQASAWISIAQTQGISATQLQTTFNGLSRNVETARTAFQKAGESEVSNLARIHVERLRVQNDMDAYHTAVQRYGADSTQASAADATLISAQNTLKGYLDNTTGSLTGAAGAFAKLGISSQQLQQVQGNMPGLLGLIADKFQSMGAGTDRAQIAQQIFGRGYAQLLPILDQGSAGIQKNIDVATEYGATLSGPTLRGMEALRAKQQQLSLEMEGMRVRIATAVEPVLIAAAGDALHLGNVFLNVVTAGVNAARGALDQFLGTKIGQGIQTIVGDAGRFATMVRDRFVRDLTRPMSFSRLFDHFETDLTTWLPHAASQFWHQLNQDLFSTGANVATVPVRMRLHATGQMTAQMAGQGIFPGMDWTSLGLQLGGDIVHGIENAITKGRGAMAAMQAWLGDVVTWITKGGGAEQLVSGGLQIADALVQAIFDPRVWIANWRPILDLALVFFSDGLTSVGKGAAKDMLGAIAERLMNVRWIGDVVAGFRGLPVALANMFREALAGLNDWASQNLGRFGQFMVRMITAGLELLPVALRGLARLALGGFEDIIASVRGHLENIFEVGFLADLFLKMLQFATKTIVGDWIVGLGQQLIMGMWHGMERGFDYIQSVIEKALGPTGMAVVRGFGEGLARGFDWLVGFVEGLFDSFVNDVEKILGIASPSTVAMAWGRDIVLGFVRGLEGLPVIGRVFSLEFRAIELIVSHAISYIRGVVGAEVGYFRAWANLIGDLIHGRWSHIMGDLEGIVRAGIHLVNSILGGLPGAILRLDGVVLNAAIHLGERILHGVVNEVKKLPGQARTQIEHLGNMITSLGGWLLREGVKIGSAIVHGAINGLEHLGSSLKSKAEGLIGDALSSLNPFSPVEHGGKIYIADPIIRGTVNGLDPLHDQLQQAISPPLRQVMNNATTQGRGQGHTMGTGITQGIRSGLNPLQSMLQSAIVGASNGALAGAKRALGISSPSRLYAEQIGRPLAEGIVHGMGGLEQALQARITKAAQAAMTASGSYGSSTPGGTAATGANQQIGYQMMLAAGWPASQWGALQALWNRESGWNQYARNPSSGAFGIPQELGHSVSAAYLAGDVHAQIAWGLDYIRGRYGSPGAAWAHETQVGWYHQGGVVPGSPTQNVPIMARGQEVVFTPEQMKMMSGRSINIGQINIYDHPDPHGFVTGLNALAARVA